MDACLNITGINTGASQGCVLSPVLRTLYTSPETLHSPRAIFIQVTEEQLEEKNNKERQKDNQSKDNF